MAVPVLLPQSPQSCSATSAAPAAPDRAGVPGAHDGGGLQLCYGKQLCPLFPPHAEVHEWSSSIVKETCGTAGDLARVLAESKMVLKGDRVQLGSFTCLLLSLLCPYLSLLALGSKHFSVSVSKCTTYYLSSIISILASWVLRRMQCM